MQERQKGGKERVRRILANLEQRTDRERERERIPKGVTEKQGKSRRMKRKIKDILYALRLTKNLLIHHV